MKTLQHSTSVDPRAAHYACSQLIPVRYDPQDMDCRERLEHVQSIPGLVEWEMGTHMCRWQRGASKT